MVAHLSVELFRCAYNGCMKPREEFSRCKSNPRGLHSYCKSCMSLYNAGTRDRVSHQPRVCELDTCNEVFTPEDVRRRFCSPKCKQAAKYRRDNPKVARTCGVPDCDVDITHRRSDTLYCSDKCTQKARITPELRRKYRLAHTYGITPQDYDQMVIDQGNVCALCDSPEPGTKHGFWHIDHCHETGVLRKLLCSTCNTGLGSFYDNPDVLRRAADYIEAHRPE